MGISQVIIHDRLDNLKYLIIDKKAEIPPYCYVVHPHNETPRKGYTITEFLTKQQY